MGDSLGSAATPARFIFHIAFERDWKSAEATGAYRVSTRGARLDDVGFIHTGFEHQVSTVGAVVFKDALEPLVVLVIDTERLDVPVVVENLEGGEEGFPHIYGALPVRAVVDVRPASLTADGRFIVRERRHRSGGEEAAMTAAIALVGKVDHLFVPFEDPQTARDFFVKDLRLPEAWPYQWFDLPGVDVASCGVNLGNANLEILLSNTSVPPFTADDPVRVKGIAFEPDHIDDAYLTEVDRRQIEHTPPLAYDGKLQGHTGLKWTNVFFFGLARDPWLFACEYHIAEYRDRLARQRGLDDCNGGLLGVEGLDEVVIGANDLASAIDNMQRLVDPHQAEEPGRWRIGSGPAIRIVAAPHDGVRSISLAVRSVESARAALVDLGVPTRNIDNGIAVDGSPLAGLDLRIVLPPGR